MVNCTVIQSAVILDILGIVLENSFFDSIFLLRSCETPDIPHGFPQIVYSAMETTPVLNSKFNNELLSVLFIEDLEVLEEAATALKGNLESKVLIISKLNVADIFSKADELNLQNVVIFQGEEYFSYHPFQNPADIFRVSKENIFKNAYFKDFGGLSITNFVKTSDKKCITNDCQVVKLFAEAYNANLTLIVKDNVTETSFNYFREKGSPKYVRANFLNMVRTVIMVPRRQKLSKNRYFILPFQKATWICIGVTLILLDLFLLIQDYWIKKSKKSWLRGLQIYMGQSVGSRNVKVYVRAIEIMLVFFGFFFNTLYSSSLGSFYVTEIQTSVSKIKCHPSLSAYEKIAIKKKFQVQFELDSNFIRERHELHRNYGFCATSMSWNSEMKFQKRFKRKVFEILIGFKEKPYAPYIHKNVSDMVMSRFNEYLLKAFSFGLTEKWASDGEIRNVSRKLLKHNDDHSQVLSTDDFMFVMRWYWYCMMLASICFAMEIVIFKVKRYYRLRATRKQIIILDF